MGVRLLFVVSACPCKGTLLCSAQLTRSRHFPPITRTFTVHARKLTPEETAAKAAKAAAEQWEKCVGRLDDMRGGAIGELPCIADMQIVHAFLCLFAPMFLVLISTK